MNLAWLYLFMAASGVICFYLGAYYAIKMDYQDLSWNPFLNPPLESLIQLSFIGGLGMATLGFLMMKVECDKEIKYRNKAIDET